MDNPNLLDEAPWGSNAPYVHELDDPDYEADLDGRI